MEGGSILIHVIQAPLLGSGHPELRNLTFCFTSTLTYERVSGDARGRTFNVPFPNSRTGMTIRRQCHDSILKSIISDIHTTVLSRPGKSCLESWHARDVAGGRITPIGPEDGGLHTTALLYPPRLQHSRLTFSSLHNTNPFVPFSRYRNCLARDWTHICLCPSRPPATTSRHTPSVKRIQPCPCAVVTSSSEFRHENPQPPTPFLPNRGKERRLRR
jgi:hypothetical protein